MSTVSPEKTDLEADVLSRPGSLGERLRRLSRMQASQIVLIWLAIALIFSALAPTAFFDVSNFRQVAVNTAILAVLGVGTTFIIITAGIDLSMGSVLLFSGVMAAIVQNSVGDGTGWGVALLSILAALASGACWGLLNGFLVAKAKVPPMIVTLGTYGAALGLTQVITGGIDKRATNTELIDTVGFGRVLGIPILVIIAAVIVTFGVILLSRTKFGLYTCAVGSNAEGCRRVGINVDLHLIKVYTLAGTLAGLAGLLNLVFFRSTTIGGHSLTNLDVIAGVVIGGTSLFGGVGTVFGTVVGLLIPATLRNGFIILEVAPYWQQVVVGAFLVIAVYVDQVRRASAARAGAHKKKSIKSQGKD